MSEAFAPRRQDDTRFPQAPTVVNPDGQTLATPVRVTKDEQPEEQPGKDPKEVAEEEARRVVLQATGKRKKRRASTTPQASAGAVPANR